MERRSCKIRSAATAILLATLLVLSSTHTHSQNFGAVACTGIKGSEFGGGLFLLFGNLLSSNSIALNAIAGYQYYAFNGGHDNYMKVGAQATKKVADEIVAGLELSFVRDVSVYDYSEMWDKNPAGNGLEAGALVKYPLPVEGLNLNLVGNVAMVFFGEFKSEDYVVEESHSTFKANVGIEIIFGKKK